MLFTFEHLSQHHSMRLYRIQVRGLEAQWRQIIDTLSPKLTVNEFVANELYNRILL